MGEKIQSGVFGYKKSDVHEYIVAITAQTKQGLEKKDEEIALLEQELSQKSEIILKLNEQLKILNNVLDATRLELILERGAKDGADSGQ